LREIVSTRIGAVKSKQMKPQPAPHVPGNTEAEKFDNAVRKIFSVSKKDFLKAEEHYQQSKQSKKQADKKAN